MIICAAIKIEFTNQYNLNETVIVHGLRHGDCFTTMTKMSDLPPRSERIETQGFVDNNGVFYDRLEAFHVASACNQLSSTTKRFKEEHKENELYSEDLY